jgi:hypothetical protein
MKTLIILENGEQFPPAQTVSPFHYSVHGISTSFSRPLIPLASQPFNSLSLGLLCDGIPYCDGGEMDKTLKPQTHATAASAPGKLWLAERM